MGLMIIKDLKIFQYNLPLTETVLVKGQKMSHREGLIIQIISEHGYEGFGEIAPLPGLSRDTLKAATDQIKKIKPQFIGRMIPAHIEKLDGKFESWLRSYKLLPSVRFGIEMASLNLLSNTKKIPLNQLLSQEHHDAIKIHALVYGNKDTVQKQAKELLAQGFKSIKLKVGEDIKEEIEKIKAINQAINGQAVLHLDANQIWDLEKAVELADEITCAAVIYIEEPFKDPKDIPQFFTKTLIPVALDESLIEHPFEEIKSIEGVDVIILKPTILGGIEKIRHMINEAKRLAIEFTLSSSYETSIGLLTLAHIAGSSSRDFTAGLDTFKWFKNDLLKSKLKIEHGKLNIKGRMVHTEDIDFSLLTELQ
jgi:o-succinylbenzoate synthase